MMALITISVSLDNVFCAISAAAFPLVGPWALFIESVTWEKCKFNFKIRSHCTIHIFKIYFATVFSVISSIYTDLKEFLNKS